MSPGTVTPTGALALVGERCVLEGGAGREEVRRGWVGGEGGGKGKGGKGVSFEEGEEVGEGVGVLVENVGIRRLAGI